jgi:hypothetical protein
MHAKKELIATEIENFCSWVSAQGLVIVQLENSGLILATMCGGTCSKEGGESDGSTHVVYCGGHEGRLGTTEWVLIIAFITGVGP